MKLQPSYDAISEVPEGYESAFEEQDGKAVFKGGEFEFKTESEFNEVKTAKKEGFDKYHALKDKMKPFEGVSFDQYKANLEELDVLRAGKSEGDEDEEARIKAIVDARVERATETLTKTNESLSSEVNELKGFKQETQKTKVLNKILKANVSSKVLIDAKTIIGAAVERDADGTYVSNGSNGFEKGLSVEKLVEKAIESRPHWKKESVSGHEKNSDGKGTGNKIQQFNALLAKKQKEGKLTRAEEKQMDALANQIKTERKGA